MNPSRDDMFKAGVATPISTFSIVIGDMVWSRCNAHCPPCVSRMSNTSGLRRDCVDQHLIDWCKVSPRLLAAHRFAQASRVTTLLFTGKGEPTLYPNEIGSHLQFMADAGFSYPFIEVQTNGIAIANGFTDGDINEGKISPQLLEYWHNMGLTHIAISIAHWDSEMNNKIYGAKKPVDLEGLMSNLDMAGFSVRVCLLLMKDYIDSVDGFKGVVGLCNSWGARQLKITPINHPKESDSEGTRKWVETHLPEHVDEIVSEICDKGTYLRTLPHGAPVFDYDGLSVCVSDCLPRTNRVGNGMQPIFWPDGSMGYSWEHRGAVLL